MPGQAVQGQGCQGKGQQRLCGGGRSVHTWQSIKRGNAQLAFSGFGLLGGGRGNSTGTEGAGRTLARKGKGVCSRIQDKCRALQYRGKLCLARRPCSSGPTKGHTARPCFGPPRDSAGQTLKRARCPGGAWRRPGAAGARRRVGMLGDEEFDEGQACGAPDSR